MSFNAAKCHLLKITRKRTCLKTHYYIGSTVLQQVSHHPYLGVELSSDLTWKNHIGMISGKAQKILNLLRRHLYNCNKEVKEKAFNSLVRPHLEYSSAVWDPYFNQDIQTLEKIQRKGARFVTGNYSSYDSVTSMLNQLDWQPLHSRRKTRRLIHFHKAVNNLSPLKLPDYVLPTHHYGTRSHKNSFIEIRANFDQYKNSFIPRTIRDWNALPPDLVQLTSAEDFSRLLQSKLYPA